MNQEVLHAYILLVHYSLALLIKGISCMTAVSLYFKQKLQSQYVNALQAAKKELA